MTEVEFVEIDWRGRGVRIELQWVNRRSSERPLVVFLHEGLGSVGLWKDFPRRCCEALGVTGLVYSRPGYGRSSPRESLDAWAADFMHRQAYEVLPTLLRCLHVEQPPWLFGHSDGASIALLYAARFPDAARGLVLLAPHLFVEELSLSSIRATRCAYLDTDLRQRLARYHDDVDSAFWGWNDIWLDPGFAAWTIEAELSSIDCPVLAIQGRDDEYGTLEQVRRLARRVPQTELIELAACGHSPHRDQPARVIEAAARFVSSGEHQHASQR